MTDPSPRYDAAYYQAHCSEDGSLVYERNDHWLWFFGGVADEIVRRLQPTSVFDAGCAHGFLVEALVHRGVDARGIDGSEFAISQAHESIEDRVEVGSITDPIDGRFDLVTCIEVIEHLPSRQVGEAFGRLTAVTDTILLSSTPEDIEEPTHLNVQPPEYWAEALSTFGFFRDVGFDATFLTPWAALYRRRDDMGVPSLVRELEREAWHLRSERDRLRKALLEVTQASGGGDANALHAVAEQLRHDLRVAVDAVRGAEAERATAAGHVKELEAVVAAAEEREKEFVDLVAKIDHDAAEARREFDELRRSLSFRLFAKAIALYRRARSFG